MLYHLVICQTLTKERQSRYPRRNESIVNGRWSYLWNETRSRRRPNLGWTGRCRPRSSPLAPRIFGSKSKAVRCGYKNWWAVTCELGSRAAPCQETMSSHRPPRSQVAPCCSWAEGRQHLCFHHISLREHGSSVVTVLSCPLGLGSPEPGLVWAHCLGSQQLWVCQCR